MEIPQRRCGFCSSEICERIDCDSCEGLYIVYFVQPFSIRMAKLRFALECRFRLNVWDFQQKCAVLNANATLNFLWEGQLKCVWVFDYFKLLFGM